LDRVFLRQQLKFQGINLDNGNGKPSKGTLQEILANPDEAKQFHTASATKATPKLGKPEKATLS
jgi:hypothetical protein